MTTLGPGITRQNAVALQGVPISTTLPTDTQVLKYVAATNLWTPSTDAAGTGTVTSIVQGTGMSFSVTPITTTGTINLANTAVTPASYTNANITVDQQGRITAASSGLASGLVLLETHVASNSTSLDFTTGFSDTYDVYELVSTGLVSATDGATLSILLSTNGGSSWVGSGYGWWETVTTDGSTTGQSGSASTTSMRFGGGASNAATFGNTFRYTLWGFRSAALYKFVGGPQTTFFVGGGFAVGSFGGNLQSATVVNGLRIIASAGNLASGTVRLYGLKNS